MKAEKHEREVLAETENGKVTIDKKMSIEQSKKILDVDGNNYTDEQIKVIRDFIYAMATIDYLFFTEQHLKNKSQTLNPETNEQESNSLHQGEYRRAS